MKKPSAQPDHAPRRILGGRRRAGQVQEEVSPAWLARLGKGIPLLRVQTATGKILWASAAAEELFGVPHGLAGRALADLSPEWAGSRVRRLLSRLAEGQEAVREQAEPWLHAEGEFLWAEVTVLPREEGTEEAFLVLREVSDMRRLEHELAEATTSLRAAAREVSALTRKLAAAEAQREALWENPFVAVLWAETESYTIRATNPRACELLGYSPEELVYRPLSDLDASESLEYSPALVKCVSAGPQQLEYAVFRGAGGERLQVQAAARPVQAGGETLVQVVFYPLERTYRLEAALEEATRRMRQHARDLERTNQDLEAANRAKSEFLATMSHEIRTPLNAIIGFSQLLEIAPEEHLAPRERQYVQDVRQAGEHLLALINDILDLARVESGRMQIEHEPLALRPLIQGVCSVARSLAEPRRIPLQVTVEPPDLGAWGDERRVKQVLFNLLSNAIRYGPPEQPIEIEARPEGDMVRVEVRDHGPGIPLEYQERIFLEFESLPTEGLHEPAGTGLGLPLSQKMVERMGGKLTLESEAGQGSTFGLTLPRYVAPGVGEGTSQVENSRDDVRG
ncbi:MAG: PAS domain S-box protein [candidate division WS1 bacterium]|nr:PAS domain S-box protein [candidate division WS1 bacterium]